MSWMSPGDSVACGLRYEYMAESGSVLSPNPRARPASWSTTAKRSSGLRSAELLRIMSPDSVPEKYGSGGTVMAITSGASGRAPIRISPKRGSPCDQPGDAEGSAAVGRQADRHVGLRRPGLEGLDDHILPTGGGGELAVEGLEQVALFAGDRCAVGREAQGEMGRIQPGKPENRRGDSGFQLLHNKRS